MKLTDFKIGDKFRLPGWDEEYYYSYSEEGSLIYMEEEPYEVTREELLSNDWELYKEPRKKEIWYRFEYKRKGHGPVSARSWFRNVEDFKYNFCLKDFEFDVEPRVYQSKEF